MFPLIFFSNNDQSPVDIALFAHPKVQFELEGFQSGPVDTKNIKMCTQSQLSSQIIGFFKWNIGTQIMALKQPGF